MRDTDIARISLDLLPCTPSPLYYTFAPCAMQYRQVAHLILSTPGVVAIQPSLESYSSRTTLDFPECLVVALDPGWPVHFHGAVA
jgi:hypothetical protein